MKNEALLDDFKQSLIAAGKSKSTIKATMNIIRRFLRHVGDTRLDRLTEEVTRAFFDGYEGQTRRQYAMSVSEFLKFAAAGLPALVTDRGSERIPRPIGQGSKRNRHAPSMGSREAS